VHVNRAPEHRVWLGPKASGDRGDDCLRPQLGKDIDRQLHLDPASGGWQASGSHPSAGLTRGAAACTGQATCCCWTRRQAGGGELAGSCAEDAHRP